MTDLLLAEDVFLLGHDDESGKNEVAGPIGVSGALGGALLLDLALGGFAEVDADKNLVPTGVLPGHPLLRQAVDAITAEKKQRSVREWVSYLPARLKPMEATVGRSLVDRGILGEEKAKVLGLFPTTHWPERDPGPEQALRARLREVLVDRATPTPREVALAALLHIFTMVHNAVDKDDRKQAAASAKALTAQAKDSDVVTKAIGDAVAATQLAIITAIVASNAAVATTVITTSGM